MKKLNSGFYFIIAGTLFPGLLLFLCLIFYPRQGDYLMFHYILSHWNTTSIVQIVNYSIAPPAWIPFYNALLIVLFVTFGRRFYRVVFGAVLLIFICYLLVTISTWFGFADHATFDPTSLTQPEIQRLLKWSLFSYRHIAFMFALSSYFGALLPDRFNWLKTLILFCAVLILFSYVKTGSILPFSAVAACFLGNLTGCIISPFYIQQFIQIPNISNE